MTDYRPTSGKAEIHLTYRCSIACRHCNRASYLREPHTPDMTVADVEDFLNQARDLDWYPALLLIGGEPTMHPDFKEICRLCAEFGVEGMQGSRGYAKKGLKGLVQLWSNQTTDESRAACAWAQRKYSISVVRQTIKVNDTIPIQYGFKGEQHDRYEFDIQDMFVSPHDLGYGLRPHCWQHGAEICGISVDAEGYAPCAIGGAIDGVLQAGIRTKRLADLFDMEKAAEITAKMCKHCGSCLYKTGISNVVDNEEWKRRVAEMPKWHGMPVSPTWEKAFEGRK